MTKTLKKLLASFLATAIILATAPLIEPSNPNFDLFGLFPTASAIDETSGTCGTNVKYTFDSSTGKLVISTRSNTKAEMADYDLTDNTSPFCGDSSIKSIYISSGITHIGECAFSGCSSATCVYIDDDVATIGDRAFLGCTSLSEIEIPYSVTSIGNYAFNLCANLQSVLIPLTTRSIGEGAFQYCSKLARVSFDTICLTEIGNRAFYYCKSLTSIKLPVNYTGEVFNIGKNVFEKCSNLKFIQIPSVNSIGDGTFSGCPNLQSIYFLGTEEKWNNALNNGSYGTPPSTDLVTFFPYICNHNLKNYYCWAYDEVTQTAIIVPYVRNIIPNTSDIQETNAQKVIIDSGITEISNEAFQNFYNLKAVTIPDSVEAISATAFSGCSNLASISVDAYNPLYDSRNNCNAIIISETNILVAGCENTVIPDGVTRIGNYAFDGRKTMKSMKIPDSVTSIGKNAFSYCDNLLNIEIPDNVTSIGENAFYKCLKLESIKIPKSVTSIDEKTFYGCNNLKDIYFTGTLTEWNRLMINTSSGNSILKTAKVHCTPAITASENNNMVVDVEKGLIYGLAPNLDDLDKFIEVPADGIIIECNSKKLGTGSVVNITKNGEVIDSYKIVIFGDTTGDSWYNGTDAMIVNCIANGMLTKEQVGEAVYMAADCNHDGVIDNLDVELLQQAGVLLANVDQSKSEEELQTSSAYAEYLNLIDQNPVNEKYNTDNDIITSYSKQPLDFIADFIAFIKNLLNLFKTIFA